MQVNCKPDHWLVDLQKANQSEACLVSNWLTFSIDLCFQWWTYACTWSNSKSLRNGCKIIVVLQICSKNEQNGGSCYSEDFITTWHENLNWTNLDTKQLFLQKAWLECDQIWVAYFLQTFFLLLFDHHPLGFADNLNQNKE